MNILLLGGTGAMGTHLVNVLNKEDNKIFVTSRISRKNIDNVIYLKGNAHNSEFLIRILRSRQWDAIVDFMIYETKEFRNRVEIILKSTKHYVFLSSARVYADSVYPLTEKSPRLLEISEDEKFLSTDDYSLAKSRQEDILMSSGKNNWTIIRPYITYGENRFQLGVLEKEFWLKRALQGKTVVLSRKIANAKTTLTYGKDVSCCIGYIIGNLETYGQIYNVTSEHNRTWEQIFQIYAQIIKKELGVMPKLRIVDDSSVLNGRYAYNEIYDRHYNRIFDNSKILDINPNFEFSNPEDGIADCLIYFIRNGKFKEINIELEAKMDRLNSEWINISEITSLKDFWTYFKIRFKLDILKKNTKYYFHK